MSHKMIGKAYRMLRGTSLADQLLRALHLLKWVGFQIEVGYLVRELESHVHWCDQNIKR